MSYTIIPKPHMNRVYVMGDVTAIQDLLSDSHAHRDDMGYWLPQHQEQQLRTAVAAEPSYQAARAAERSSWERAKSVIPVDHKTRHGAMLGGTIRIGDETMEEPALNTSTLPWVEIASYTIRVRDLAGQSLIGGRIMDRETLYSAPVVDGRMLYRISHYRSFGDDLRETYYLPSDLWAHLMAAEAAMRGITPEQARGWLAEYRGCVGTELYEFAADAGSVLLARAGLTRRAGAWMKAGDMTQQSATNSAAAPVGRGKHYRLMKRVANTDTWGATGVLARSEDDARRLTDAVNGGKSTGAGYQYYDPEHPEFAGKIVVCQGV